jgi:RNAse (barnase) inhibitor barstar
MKELIIDFRNVKTYWEFYEVIIKGLELPKWCGKNPDAIWDLMLGNQEHSVKVIVLGIDQLPREFNEIKEVEIIKRVFDRASNYFGDHEYTFIYLDSPEEEDDSLE